MTPTIGWSDFALNRHQPYSGNSYTTISNSIFLDCVANRWGDRKPGMGETTLDRKVVVPFISDKNRFYTPFVELRPDLPVKARVTQRQPGEDYYIETYISAEDAQRLGIRPKTAKRVDVVCYSAEALLENGGTRSTDCEWEIVALLCSDNEEEEVMRPLTMARNYLELTGGTKSVYTAEEFAKAIMYWSANKGIKIIEEG